MKMNPARKRVYLLFCVLSLGVARPSKTAEMILGKGEIKIYLAPAEYAPVKLAADRLFEGAHGNFTSWYAGNSERGIFNVSELIKNVKSTLDVSKQQPR